VTTLPRVQWTLEALSRDWTGERESMNWLGLKAVHTVPRLRMNGAIMPFHNTSSYSEQDFTFFLTVCVFDSARVSEI
jgi:hypothetical protein